MLTQLEAEIERLKGVAAAYGDEDGAFDRAMRVYMMRTFEPWWRPGNCLQIGCSHGDQTSLLAARFDEVHVVEPMQEFIDKTRRRVDERVIFTRSLIEEYETETRFDNIVISHVLEHFDDPVQSIGRLLALLKPGGRLFLVVPNGGAASRRIAVKMGVISHNEGLSAADVAAGHRRVYQLDTLCREARSSGGKIVHSGGIFFKPLANFQFDALIGGPLISDAFMEGCYQLGFEHPTFAASVFVVVSNGYTRSVTLRALERADLVLIHRWFQDPDLVASLGSPFRFRAEEEATAYMANWLQPHPTEVRLVIAHDGDAVGMCKIAELDQHNRCGSFHTLIGEAKNRGRGFGRMAVTLALDHAFVDLGLNRLDLSLLADNDAAHRLYLACGFRDEGLRRQAVFKRGAWRDVITMGILAQEHLGDRP